MQSMVEHFLKEFQTIYFVDQSEITISKQIDYILAIQNKFDYPYNTYFYYFFVGSKISFISLQVCYDIRPNKNY